MCNVSEWTHNYGYSTFSYPHPANHITSNCEGFGPPVIQTQPQDRTVNCGQNATFNVVVRGEGLTYQWYFNDVSITGATGAGYTVVGATLAKAGYYHAVVRSGADSVTSRHAKLTVNCAPEIVTQPAPQNVRAGGTATFSVQAIGTATLSYQWRKDGNIIPGATGWNFTKTGVQTTDQGNYSVVVANAYGSVTSVNALLTVISGDVIYTSNADFDKGYAVNLNHTAVADRLQINANPTPFPFVNMACSGRGTLARIDANTGAIVGEYQTAPDIGGVVLDSSPSRTTVDRWGNVWVANREDNQQINGNWMGSLSRIGLVIGGIRGSVNGGVFTPDPNGDYLSPPFLYNTCKDRYGATVSDPPDGYLKTSRALADIRRWLNGSGQDTAGGVSTAQDEAILNYVRTVCTETRTVAVDKNNNVWVGGLDRGPADHRGEVGYAFPQRHQQINGLTGLPVPNTVFSPGAGGYGGLVDGYGVLWPAMGDPWIWPTAGWGLLRFVPSLSPPPAGTWVALPPWDEDGWLNGDYGLAIDPRTQLIWHSWMNDSPGWVAKLNRDGTMAASYPHGFDWAQGLVVDNQYNVWVAHSSEGGRDVGHLRTDGTTFVGNVDLGGAAEGPAEPTGVAVDSNGKIWASAFNHNCAVRIDPNGGAFGGGGFRIGAVDLRVDLGDENRHQDPYRKKASPYNYSDMTGFVTLGSTFPSGSWIVVHDEGVLDRQWRKLAWSANTPAGSGIQVEVRAANTVTQLPNQDFLDISIYNDSLFGLRTGRYLEIRVTLWHDPLSTANPFLDWLKVYAPQ